MGSAQALKDRTGQSLGSIIISPRCGRKHTGVCPTETMTYYVYGNMGHLARACPGNPNPRVEKCAS